VKQLHNLADAIAFHDYTLIGKTARQEPTLYRHRQWLKKLKKYIDNNVNVHGVITLVGKFYAAHPRFADTYGRAIAITAEDRIIAIQKMKAAYENKRRGSFH
jgi:type IV secretory pathway protease TraF